MSESSVSGPKVSGSGTALTRLRYDLRAVAGLAFIVVLVATLAATAPTLADALGEAGLVKKIEQAPAAERGVLVSGRVERVDVDSLDEVVRSAIEPIPEMSIPARLVVSNAFAVDVVTDADPVASLGWWQGPTDLIGEVDGRLPSSPSETAVPRAMAEELNLSVGDVLPVEREGARLELEVVGLFDPEDDLAGFNPQMSEGVTRTGSFVEFGPLLVTGETFATGSDRVSVSWMSVPVTTNVRADGIPAWRTAVAALDRKVAPLAVDSGLNTLLAGSVVGVRAASVTIAAIFGLVTLLALIGLGTAALAAIERRRVELELTRSRGAGVGQMLVDSATEGSMFALVAVAVAPALAVAAVAAGGASGLLGGLGEAMRPRLSAGGAAMAVVAGVACVAVLTFPVLATRGGYVAARAARTGRESQGVVRRNGLDLVFAALGLLALWRLREEWTPGSGRVDPMVWAAPILVWLAGIVLLGRVGPWFLDLLERRTSSGSFSWTMPAAWAARAPGRSVRHAILVSSSTAVLLLVSVYGATWWTSQLDQARLELGAAAAGDRTGTGGSPFRARSISVGRVTGVRLVALETERISVRGDLVTPMGAWESLSTGPAGAAPSEPGFGLAGAPVRSMVIVESTGSVAPPSIRMSLVTMDSDGVVTTTDEIAIATGSSGPVEFVPTGGGPWRLLGLRVALPGVEPLEPGVASPITVSATVRVDGVDTGESDWDASALASPLAGARAAAEADDGGVKVTIDAAASGRQLGVVSEVRLVTRERPPIPALATPALLEQTGLSLGDRVALTVGGSTPDVVLAGTIGALPGDPGRPLGMVVDYSSLATIEWEQGTDYGAPDLRLYDDPDHPDVVITADELRQTRIADPVSVAVLGALGSGAVAVAGVTIIALVYGVGVSIEGRRFELALLQALGVSNGEVRRMLRRESLMVAVVGAVGGLVLGGLLAVVTVGSLARDVDGNRILPAPLLVVPWWGVMGAIVLGVGSMLVASRSASGATESPGTIIRAGEER